MLSSFQAAKEVPLYHTGPIYALPPRDNPRKRMMRWVGFLSISCYQSLRRDDALCKLFYWTSWMTKAVNIGGVK